MSDIERESIEVETPVGHHKLKLKAWLTGSEKMKLAKIDRSDIEASSRGAIETIVMGTGYEEIAEYHGKDFDFVMGEMTKIVEGSSIPKAENSSANTPA